MNAPAPVRLPVMCKVSLPLPRAARAPDQQSQFFSGSRHPGAREHGFGEDRRRAAPAGGEHLRVGASVAEREDSNPADGAGDNLNRHATLRANAVKLKAKWVRISLPLVDVRRRESTEFGQRVGSRSVAVDSLLVGPA
jgi:hypothetical protein